MKKMAKSKIVTIAMGMLVVFSSCEKNEPFDQDNSGNYTHSRDITDPDVFFKIGRRGGSEFKFSDIELYDSSTHIIYFKNEYDEFTEDLNCPFYFLDNGHTIYSGIFWPGYFSYIPFGPIIMSHPNMYGKYALRIEIWMDDKPDIRNCPRMIEILNRHDLLHSGLSGSIDFTDIYENELSFGFTVNNQDITDLLILDLNKTGPGLFHYFTNGLYIRTDDHLEIFSGTIPHQKPEPWDSWKEEWLTLLKSGESMSFTINYPIEDPIPPGDYNLIFEFPGFHYQVSKSDLFQGNSRIWLGDITFRKRITVP